MAYLRAFFSLFPAHAGVIPMPQLNRAPNKPFPRTRGGDPLGYVMDGNTVDFSPHTRG